MQEQFQFQGETWSLFQNLFILYPLPLIHLRLHQSVIQKIHGCRCGTLRLAIARQYVTCRILFYDLLCFFAMLGTQCQQTTDTYKRPTSNIHRSRFSCLDVITSCVIVSLFSGLMHLGWLSPMKTPELYLSTSIHRKRSKAVSTRAKWPFHCVLCFINIKVQKYFKGIQPRQKKHIARQILLKWLVGCNSYSIFQYYGTAP